MLRIAHEPAPIDDGITVAEAARVLGCDETTVRELVHRRQVKGWWITKGKRGTKPRAIRVSRLSCLDYRDRNEIGDGRHVAPPPPPGRSRPSAAHQEAVAYLRSLGWRV